MTQEQLNLLDKLISGNVNNTNLLGQDLKKQYDKTLNIEKSIALMMENQNKIFSELQYIKRLLFQMPQK